MLNRANLSKSSALAGILAFSFASSNANAANTVFQQFVGDYGVSTSGWGSTTQSGTISTTVPVGSTVVAAYLYSSTFQGASSAGGTLGGSVVNYSAALGQNNAQLQAFRADVTSIVAPVINGGAGGTYNFAITETNSLQDGEGLVVVYTNASRPTQTVAILNGFSQTTGDSSSIHFGTPLNPAASGFFAHMAIGDGFSCCSQASNISVNGLLMTTVAGNNDSSVDPTPVNGNLITVGNINGPYTGGTPGSPQNVYANDHEAYDLSPFIKLGDTNIVLNTVNPSNDDNIFLEVFNVSGAATVVTTGVPEPSTWIMMILGFCGLGFMAYRRKQNGSALSVA
jgi:hypothetical protein